uniref:Uncharacterized protein n=1 Tax=Oryza meridionalis TaxID=40149 RepID=A0A0E0F2R1_9ORYZ
MPTTRMTDRSPPPPRQREKQRREGEKLQSSSVRPSILTDPSVCPMRRRSSLIHGGSGKKCGGDKQPLGLAMAEGSRGSGGHARSMEAEAASGLAVLV